VLGFAHAVDVQSPRNASLSSPWTQGTSLAESAPVATCILHPRSRASRRGFTLLELMVVVIVVGVLAALAVPSMRIATYDRHAYEDAGAIMQLFRDARLRSVARGSAVLVSMGSNGTTDRGTFVVTEAVAADPSGGTAMPVPVCKSPTVWTSPPKLVVEGLNLNGGPEKDADIETQIFQYSGVSGSNPAAKTTLTAGTSYLCYTPLGRSYFNASTPSFSGSPSTSVFEVMVSRGLSNGLLGATTRSVIIEPNGMPRILTKLL
jgi:prepilin-type N-terminal cleavage/methylation domain-containing protein